MPIIHDHFPGATKLPAKAANTSPAAAEDAECAEIKAAAARAIRNPVRRG
jgi:hypothetical protein